jgi:inner membrane protein YidH
VITKFNLFMLTLAHSAVTEPQRSELRRLVGRVGQYDGLALVFGGVCLLLLATVRFVRTARLLDRQPGFTAASVRTELILSAWLLVLIVSYSLYLALS